MNIPQQEGLAWVLGIFRRALCSAVMEFPLETRAVQAFFMLALSATALFLVLVAGRIAAVEMLTESDDIHWVERGIRLDPANPQPHFRLGTIYSHSLEHRDAAKAVYHMRRATELNPQHGRYWLALASAAERYGDTATAQDATRRALELRPMSPEFWWRAGNFYLRAGQEELAAQHFRRLLELNPDQAEPVFRLLRLAARDRTRAFETLLPPESAPSLQLAYAGFLSREGEPDAAFTVWRRIHSRMPYANLPFAAAQPLLEDLITQNRLDEAFSVWNDLIRPRGTLRTSGLEGGDLIYNGDFELPLLNAGFDWRTSNLPYVAVDDQSPQAYRGRRAVRADFTVPRNDEHEFLAQIVPVAPLRGYRLGAYVRCEGITSDSGPRLRVRDFHSPTALDVATPSVIGTTGWHPVSMNFRTGASTRFVRVSVWRARSRNFPTEISGTLWIDAVSLRPVDPPTVQAAAVPRNQP